LIRKAVEEMAAYFNRLGMPTRLTDFDVDPLEAAERIQKRFEQRGTILGEGKNITPDAVAEILRMSQ
jgi:NADP-dependent alcohol dehydrogenase